MEEKEQNQDSSKTTSPTDKVVDCEQNKDGTFEPVSLSEKRSSRKVKRVSKKNTLEEIDAVEEDFIHGFKKGTRIIKKFVDFIQEFK